MQRNNVGFLFLNVGHFFDHFFMLIFASVAALRLTTEWNMNYSALIPYATPGFIAFGVCAIPAGWLADKWSRSGMMAIFFCGIGVSAIVAGLANTPVQMAAGLTLIGIFAAIYHPVGLAMVIQGRHKTGVPLAVNGIFGNLGVASAALLTGFLIDTSGWRSAFIYSGLLSVLVGVLYVLYLRLPEEVDPSAAQKSDAKTTSSETTNTRSTVARGTLIRVFAVIFFTTAVGGLIFQSTTFALPKVFDERLGNLATTATMIGWYSFLVFSVAAFAQLVVGYLVDNYSIRIVFACVALLQAFFFVVMMQLTGIAALVVAVAFMLVVFGQIPINDVLVGRMVSSEWRSRAYALRYIVTFSVMASAVPLIAWVHGTWGFSALFGILGIAASLIFLAVLLLPHKRLLA